MSVFKRGKYWAVQFNIVCRNAKRLGYYTPEYEWGEWNIKDKPIRYLTDTEDKRSCGSLIPPASKAQRTDDHGRRLATSSS